MKGVSAVIPTRGDVELSPILATLGWCDDVIVWDNSAHQTDHGIYARYVAIQKAIHPVIITQDDDLIFTGWNELIEAYEPDVLTVNYPEPYDIPWVGCGAIFDRRLPSVAHRKYLSSHPYDRFFTHSACDGIFALLTPTKVLDLGYVDLAHGLEDGRVSSSPGWYDDRRPEIQRRVAALSA